MIKATWMFDTLKKDLNSESNKNLSNPNVYKTTQNLETPLSDRVQILESSNPDGELDLLSVLQKMKKEEQEVRDQKDGLLSIERQLRGKLAMEIEKTKISINNLKSEIPSLQKKCEDLAQVLEIPVQK
jgi:vacuolar-type H+-ATPase subunit D/Vma8